MFFCEKDKMFGSIVPRIKIGFLSVSIIFLYLFFIAGAMAAGININVKDFGAKGDGKTDDTLAIKRAAEKAKATNLRPPAVMRWMQAGPALVFPAGIYIISDEIVCSALEIRGEAEAIIIQTNKEKNIFVNKEAWRQKFKNLALYGGKNQIDLYNPNWDQGQIIIEHCRLVNAGGIAVKTDVCSTTVKIVDCEFIDCMQAWYNNRCDQAVMRDCWIMPNVNIDNIAVIEQRGAVLTLENIVGVPRFEKGVNLRWIDNYGVQLVCKNVRFGGESGGFTPIYNQRKYSESASGTFIKIEDSFICANGSYNANCAVYCVEVPNSIQIDNCIMFGSVPIIIDKNIDISKYFYNVSPWLLNYSVRSCIGELAGASVPEGLLRPKIGNKKSDKKILTDAETADMLKKNIASWEKKKKSTGAEPYSSKEHKQRTDSDGYMDVEKFSCDYYMDATTQKNSEWLRPAKADDDILVLYRQHADGGWPHITFNINIDLEEYPWLTFKQMQPEPHLSGQFAIKVIDLEKGTMSMVQKPKHWDTYDYSTYNLRDIFGEGKRKLEIRYYPVGRNYGKNTSRDDDTWPDAGEYMILDFIRMEKD